MKKQFLCLLCALALLAFLPACAPAEQSNSDLPSGESKLQTPNAGYAFQVLPVTQEGIRALYSWEGYQVVAITPYEGDFLVEYTGKYEYGLSLLEWVFGSTGRRVQLTGLLDFISYEITGPGEVAYVTSGVDAGTPWRGLPERGTVQVLGDEAGQLSDSYMQTLADCAPTWLDPSEPFYMGYWDASTDRPRVGLRYEQLYDARVDVDGLSLSFIPSGASRERFQSFFPACTNIPCFATNFDPDTRQFTLRLYNTCLASGDVTGDDLAWAMQDYGGLYPYAFPAGSLGRDSHFLTGAQIQSDGEDTVITFTLTEKAYRFTVETSNLGYDNIPSFRIVFREENPDIDGWA